MRWETILVAAVSASVVGCRASSTQVAGEPSLVATINAPAANDRPWTLYEDDEMAIVGVDYGRHDSAQTPGVYVFGKRNRKWIRIEKIGLQDAVLGRSPTFEECRTAGMSLPPVGWDFRSLAGRQYVDVPLTSGNFLFFPDKVEKDQWRGRLVLRFNSRCRIPPVETVLSIRLDDLRQALSSE